MDFDSYMLVTIRILQVNMVVPLEFLNWRSRDTFGISGLGYRTMYLHSKFAAFIEFVHPFGVAVDRC